MGKRIILTDESLNRYGYRVLTDGIDLESFKKNPILLYMHFRDEGSPMWGNYKAIGHWKDIRIEDGTLSAEPVFDEVDELSKTVAAKFNAGTFNAASIGIRILATSGEKEYLVPGQTRETVTKCDLMEASIVDVPANANAVRLYDRSTSACLAAGMEANAVPELKSSISSVMNLKKKWKSVLAFLKIGEDKADATAITDEQLDSLDAEFSRLQGENDQLKSDKAKAEGDLSTATNEVTTLKTELQKKDGEISTLKTDLQKKDDEIKQLKEQVDNLKKGPADKDEHLTPKSEPGSDEKEDLAAFGEKNSSDYEAMSARLKEEGLI